MTELVRYTKLPNNIRYTTHLKGTYNINQKRISCLTLIFNFYAVKCGSCFKNSSIQKPDKLFC